jgi:uncharacterized protein YcbX
MAPHLARIDLYPVKSLDGLTVETASLLASGALTGDRAFALLDEAGKFINGKREARIHQVRSRFSSDLHHLTLWTEADRAEQVFPLPWPTSPEAAANSPLAAWFSAYFQRSVTISHDAAMGFPDDTDSPGPTVISTATLATVADWFGLSLEEARCRFRTNLEIGGVPAFWEDQFFSDGGEPVPFTIGAVTLHGINPCQRCVVPTRDTHTGTATAKFQARFIEQRSQTLPEGVAQSRFNHFYRLAVNTRIPATEAGKSLRVGDPISIQ